MSRHVKRTLSDSREDVFAHGYSREPIASAIASTDEPIACAHRHAGQWRRVPLSPFRPTTSFVDKSPTTQTMAEQDPQAGDTGPPKGIPALKAHIIANKVDVALWGIRILTVLFTIGYEIPVFNNPISAYYKALLANAAISALRLHQRIPPREISLSREFLARFFLEDSAHYLFYSFIFMTVTPNLLILTPIFLFALLHAASYSLTILDTLGQNSLWVARLLISLVEFQSRNILRAAALAEIALFPLVAVMALVGYCGLLTPFVYYYFITWRYASRRNPYTRNTCRELRALAERTAAAPRTPAAVRSAILAAVALVCRMAPPVELQQ